LSAAFESIPSLIHYDYISNRTVASSAVATMFWCRSASFQLKLVTLRVGNCSIWGAQCQIEAVTHLGPVALHVGFIAVMRQGQATGDKEVEDPKKNEEDVNEILMRCRCCRLSPEFFFTCFPLMVDEISRYHRLLLGPIHFLCPYLSE
jgi:hypothetical protein